MVDFFSSKCTSFRFVVFEKDSFLDCLERMKSSRIVVESRITLRCIYLSLSLSFYMFFLLACLRHSHIRTLLQEVTNKNCLYAPATLSTIPLR